MWQRHSFHRLFFHLVFTTKHREAWIATMEQGDALFNLFRVKAAQLNAYIEEFGCYRDHVHLLVRSGPTVPLCDLYGQMKGFASWAWNRQYPARQLKWQDGVWSATVDPENSEALRRYIREQWWRHESRSCIEACEPNPECP